MTDEIFRSSDQNGNHAFGVFEYDGEVGYFYLYDQSRLSNNVVAHVRIIAGRIDFNDRDMEITWSKDRNYLGLYIKNTLWAVFDTNGIKYGGNYVSGGRPDIPSAVVAMF
jgi:hypothetical protein